MNPQSVIKRPIILSEKANRLREQNQVVFEVARTSNKIDIKHAVEQLFNVKVVRVNTMLMRGKDRRMGRSYGKLQNWKKAIVTLKEGSAIDFYGTEGA